MSIPNDQPMYSSMNGAEVVVLNAEDGVIDTTRRPLTGKALEEAKKLRARFAAADQMEKDLRKKPTGGASKKKKR